MDSKKDIQKIKKLLSHKDASYTNMGFSLLESLSDVEFVEELIAQALDVSQGTVALKSKWKIRNDSERLLELILRLMCEYSSEGNVVQGVLDQITQIRLMDLHDSYSLDGVSQLHSCQILCLHDVNVSFCSKLSELRILEVFQAVELENLSSLQGVNVHRLLFGNCPKLSNINDLSNCTELRELLLLNCPSISNFEVLDQLPNLNKIHLLPAQVSLLSESTRRRFFP